ncbi:hypothetical protein [Paractinoplanes durhamensis]|uniref:Uncharacterized protein n=1 Tax=Paractinoplanes durhamensis TaxID=113563 RepID=A0ABQ3Z0N3_9ACTN|nr:hypothetical protein [Actinoplanes durhamensis]GIE03394.1 hypothetical protein Adu01nite_47440 [Actinoplanes durhamensis]
MTAEFVRVRRRRLQTAVRRYLHPGTGRTITVIGTYHLAKPAYWQDLREVIDKLEANGAVVHCEGSTKSHPDDDVTDEERQIVDQLVRAGTLERRRIKALGWTGQVEGLGYPDSWRVVDLSTAEIVRRLGPALGRHAAAHKMRGMDWPDIDRAGFNKLRLKITFLFRFMAADNLVIKASNGSGPSDDVIVKARDQHALAEAAGADQDLVMIWGLAHLPGLDAGLIALGFERSGPLQWHTVTRRVPSICGALLRWAVRWPAPRVPQDTHEQVQQSRP